MANTSTAQETRQEYIANMGEDLGKVFYALYNETAWIFEKWDQFTSLYGTSKERVDLLNQVAGLFFRVVQDTLYHDTLMHLCRITDRPTTAGRENLTVQRLPDLIEDDEFRQELEGLVNSAVQATGFARDWRHRRLAHQSLGLALKEGAKPLKPASRKDIKNALEAISRVLNGVSLHFKDSNIAFDVSGSPGSAEALLYVIDDGLDAEKARRKRAREGRSLEEDFRTRSV